MKKTELSRKHLSIINRFPSLINVRNINSGGCGWFANHLYERLKDLGYKPKIVLQLSGKINNAKQIFEQLNCDLGNDITGMDFQMSGLWWRHIVIKVGKKLVDSDGAITMDDKKEFKDRYVVINKEILETMLSDTSGWNHYFNWNDEKVIKKRLAKALVN